MSDNEDINVKSFVYGGVIGGLIGMLGAVLLAKFTCAPFVDEARVFREEGKPAIIRLYKDGQDGYSFAYLFDHTSLR